MNADKPELFDAEQLTRIFVAFINNRDKFPPEEASIIFAHLRIAMSLVRMEETR